MLAVVEAVRRIMQDMAPLPAEQVALASATGRVLAHDAVAPYTLPQWDNAAMDGYAVRAEDIARASKEHPVRLAVVDSIAAGSIPTRPIGPGEAARIMTGAPIPPGTDSVVRVEDTDGGTVTVSIFDSRDAGRNVRPRGEDFREGETVLASGTVLGPPQVGVLASLGMAVVGVHRRPVVAIAGSGDELVDLDRFHEVLEGRRILASNSYTLAAAVAAAGGVPVVLGNAPDQVDALSELLARARGTDLLITTAGASVGEYDYTRIALESLGGKLAFWRVRMRPGAPLGYGHLDGTPWLGLPGNPVSAMVTFELFARPAIRRMLGHRSPFRRPVEVVLEEPVAIGAPLTHFLRAVVRLRADGRLGARLTGPQGSAILTSMAKANALLVVPAEKPKNEAGEKLQALLLGDEALASEDFDLEHQ